MSDVIIVGVLSLLGTLAGAWGGVRQANRLVEQRSKSNTHRLDELQDKID